MDVCRYLGIQMREALYINKPISENHSRLMYSQLRQPIVYKCLWPKTVVPSNLLGFRSHSLHHRGGAVAFTMVKLHPAATPSTSRVWWGQAPRDTEGFGQYELKHFWVGSWISFHRNLTLSARFERFPTLDVTAMRFCEQTCRDH